MYERTKILAPLLHEVVSNKEQSWPAHDGTMLDRTQFVSSSEIGNCIRRIWFSKFTPNEGSFPWGYAERGHSHEAWIVEQLRNSDQYTFSFIGEEQRSFYDGNQSGTPDGLAYCSDQGHYLTLEFKSIDPRTNRANLPKENHLMQCVQNMDLMQHCLDVDIAGTLLAYSDASNYSLIDEFFIPNGTPETHQMMDNLQERANSVMTAASAELLPPEGLYTGDCKNCAYQAQCSAAIKAKQNEGERHGKLRTTSSNVFG